MLGLTKEWSGKGGSDSDGSGSKSEWGSWKGKWKWSSNWERSSDGEWGWGGNGDGGSDADWSWAIGWGWGSIDGFSGVLDVGDVAGVSVGGVSHSLDTTVGKVDVVLAAGAVAIARLRGPEVGSAQAVGDAVGVVVCWGDISVDWDSDWGWAVGWSWGNDSWGGVLGSSLDSGEKGEQSNKALKQKKANKICRNTRMNTTNPSRDPDHRTFIVGTFGVADLEQSNELMPVGLLPETFIPAGLHFVKKSWRHAEKEKTKGVGYDAGFGVTDPPVPRHTPSPSLASFVRSISTRYPRSISHHYLNQFRLY